MGYAEKNREDTEDGAKHNSVMLWQFNDTIEQAMNNLCRSYNIHGYERITRNHCSPPGKPISSKLPAHVNGDVLEAYEFVQRFSKILGFQEVPSFKELEEELTCSGIDLNATEEVNDKVAAQRLIKSNGTLLSDIHIKLLKLLMHEMQLTTVASVQVIADNKESESGNSSKKTTSHVSSAKGCQLHVFVNELTWPEMARRYVLALFSIKRRFASTDMNDSDKSKVLCCLQGDGRTLHGSINGVASIEEDAHVLVESLKKIFGSLDTENDNQSVSSGSSGTTPASDKTMLVDNDNSSWDQGLIHVRSLPTNRGSKIRNRIRDALNKGPPLWAKEILEHSISKEVYKGNAAGPTKKLVISILNKVGSKDFIEQPDQERSKKKSLLQSAVIMRRCHFAFRCTLAGVRNKILCNLLSVQLIKDVENSEEGVLESPVKLSHPLDFRTIDARLAAGAYGTSHEAFLDDVYQVLANLRIVYASTPKLFQLANKLSEKFERHYENEVNSLFKRYGEYAESDYMVLKKEIDDILTSSRKLPKSPWEYNVCKVCGIDANDNILLLCDTCDAEYHTHCLEPPLQKVPPGKWYCPRCQEPRVESSEVSGRATPGARLPADHENSFEIDVVQELNPLVAALTQKEYWQWSIDERVYLLKFLCDEVLNTSTARQHLQETIVQPQRLPSFHPKRRRLVNNVARTNIKEMQQSEDMPDAQNNVSQTELSESEKICNVQKQLSKLSLRREYLGADSSGRRYWILSEPNRPAFLIADPNSSSIPWVSYQSEEEIEELLGWLNKEDEGERLLKKSILGWKKTKVNSLNNNENQGKGLAYGKRENNLGLKATWVIATKFASPNDLRATEGCSNNVEMKGKTEKPWRCDCLELIFSPRYHCVGCHNTFLSAMGLRIHKCSEFKTILALEKGQEQKEVPMEIEIALENGKDPSSSTAKDEQMEEPMEIQMNPLSGKSAIILTLLKMNLLDIEAALPEGALKRAKSQQEKRGAWRAFVKSAATVLEAIQAMISLEEMIKIQYLKNWWWYWSSLSTAVKTPSVSALAMRIYALDSAIEYEKKPEPAKRTKGKGKLYS